MQRKLVKAGIKDSTGKDGIKIHVNKFKKMVRTTNRINFILKSIYSSFIFIIILNLFMNSLPLNILALNNQLNSIYPLARFGTNPLDEYIGAELRKKELLEKMLKDYAFEQARIAGFDQRTRVENFLAANETVKWDPKSDEKR